MKRFCIQACRQQQYRCIPFGFAKLSHQFKTVYARHHNVAYDEIDMLVIK